METKLIPEVKKILYGTDLSKNAARAFPYAVAYAKRFDAKIVIMHTIEPLPQIARFGGYKEDEETYYRTMKEETALEMNTRLKRYFEKVDPYLGSACSDLVSNILIRVGHPVEEILKLADEEDCDLIILGSHGKGRLTQTFLGSVSRSVIERSHKPVVVVPLLKD
jgi:nucleotide-binding universal stress UspA family protein